MDPARRAMRARELLQDPLMVEAFSSIQEHCFDSWAGSKDSGAREGYWHQLQALRALKGRFEAIIEDEMIAAEQNK